MGHTYRGAKSGCKLVTEFDSYSYDGVSAGMTQLLLLGKFEYTGGPIFKVVLEC